jgi:hypothetical protein
VATVAQGRLETTASRLRELVTHLRHQRAHLREEWHGSSPRPSS